MPFPFSRRPRPSVETQDREQTRASFVLEILQILLISLVIVIPIRFFVAAPFYVKGASMEPNFYDHEYLIIDELSYRFHDPGRGEIVVFRYPKDPSQFFIKRVIGLPGETIEIANGNVRIYNDAHPNGVLLKETYLTHETNSPPQTVTLKAEQYFLMGDNRPSSLDSRTFGAVSRSLVVGRVWLRGLPIDRWTVFHTPTYAHLP